MASNQSQRVEVYDTTLRDGTQAEGLALSVEDKLRVARQLDRLGLTYLEGGWPGSNPRDREFFAALPTLGLKRIQVAAFGSTHHPSRTPEGDANLAELLAAGTEIITLVGKSSLRHVQSQLQIAPERNLAMAADSVAYLRQKGRRVFFDAEHFFDGFKEDPEYTLAVLAAAAQAGAEALVLCDTNGGSLPEFVAAATARVKEAHPGLTIGIHTHNDAELAVANTLAAVSAGARQVQGTLGGFGERCGNANLCSLIPNLQLKLGYECLEPARLQLLSETARLVHELANLPPHRFAPYVGKSAFSHKGGLHISAVEKDPALYEHVSPEAVGNVRRFLVSDLSGRAAILNKAKEWGLDLSADDPEVKAILANLKARENEGYQYEGAEASFELLMNRAMGRHQRYFELVGFRVMNFKDAEGELPRAEATVRVRVGGLEEHTAAMGHGPVNALDRAIRKALVRFFPRLNEVRLVDYKVRVLSGADGTGARVRVLIESSDGVSSWGTVGVSFDVLEASYQALGDSIRYKLFKDQQV
ncbi:MAG: citramalate synthase [Desulfarculus sp.]|nr:citramalate synthase [Desulfarculus sp.]